MVNGQVDAARAPVLVAEVLDGLPHGRGVNDRQHFPQVLGEHVVEEHLVAVVHLGEQHIPGKIGRLAGVLGEYPGGLLLQGQQPGRDQAGDAQRTALGVAEGGALVQPRVGQYLAAAQGGPPAARVIPPYRLHGSSSACNGRFHDCPCRSAAARPGCDTARRGVVRTDGAAGRGGAKAGAWPRPPAAVQATARVTGFVRRLPHPTDRSGKLVVLTEAGWECVRRTEAILAALERGWLACGRPGRPVSGCLLSAVSAAAPDGPDGIDGVRLRGRLVRPVAQHPGEPQRERRPGSAGWSGPRRRRPPRPARA